MVRILGIRIDEVDMAAALAFIAAAIRDQRQDGRLRHIVTLNPEGLYLALGDAAFARILEQADLITADGAGLLWAAQKLGHSLPQRVTGIDLLQEACIHAAREGWRIYLLGAEPGVAEQAAAQLMQNHAGLFICGWHHGYFRAEEEAVLADIMAAAPDILFVAMGLPAQETFIAAWRERLPAAVAIGVGGSLDVIAGRVKRAPRLMRQARLEWLWRLFLQPSRLPRLLVLPKFMRLVNKAAREHKRGKE